MSEHAIREYLKTMKAGGGGAVGADAPIGAIISFAGTVEPDGWFVCNGRALSRTTYADLFEAIGTTYGAGDGSTTFNIPDFRGKTAIGVSADHALGSSGGEEEHTLTISEMPSHTHTIHTSIGWQTGGGSVVGRVTTNNGNLDGWRSWADNTGGDQAHNNMQPYLTANFIIKWKNVSTSQTGITVEEMADLLRPIGSVYETEDEDFDPNVSWGGTWTMITDSVVIDITKRVVNGTIGRERYSSTSITAPTVDGYEFFLWGTLCTDNWISSLYIQSQDYPATNVWNTIADGSGPGAFHVYAIYVKRETVYRWKRTA